MAAATSIWCASCNLSSQTHKKQSYPILPSLHQLETHLHHFELSSKFKIPMALHLSLHLLRQCGHVECLYNLSLDDLCSRIGEFDALVVRSGTKAATEFGCLVVNAPTANTIAAAEHGIALLTTMARNVARADASMKAGKWERSKNVGVSVVGKTLAVMGFGRVGSEVARRGKALGMRVIAHDPYAPADTVRAIDDQGSALHQRCSWRLVDEDSLLRALDSGIVAQAAVDVFSEEPSSGDASRLAQHENVISTPHLRASTKEAQEQVAVEIAEAVVGALRGELSATALNAPIISPQVALAEKLGRIAVQLVAGGTEIQSVKVPYASPRDPDDLDTRILRAMITKGIIEPISDAHVNLVNADFIAKQKHLRISEEKVATSSPVDQRVESIQLQISGAESRFESTLLDNGRISIQGSVKQGVPHLTRVGAFSVNVSLEGNVILCHQWLLGWMKNLMKLPSKKIGEVPAIYECVYLHL
ncbi:hypothetical protein SASPL_148512 [Salvia splendens]|uniref:phosphoglycerate dehydrogenase n=1 Tax=Salvia splendens TaxID=180675 RepID=A0A8X8Z4E9_SALSN|nr:hypothetical protein SASPL_148512 [Salvia splendens]